MVATNRYVDLWCKIATQLNDLAKKNSDIEVTILLATDDSMRVKRVARSLPFLKLRLKKIPSYGWPEATLFRYQIIKDTGRFLEYDICMYLDADMFIHGDFIKKIFLDIKNFEIALVQHPGFSIINSARGYLNAATDWKILKAAILNLPRAPWHLGTWETRAESRAFVDIEKRKRYVHGAVWFGRPAAFESMCNLLSLNVERDRQKELIAIWHDESHLNWYAAHHEVGILGSEYSWVKRYRNIKSVIPLISTIDKKKEFQWKQL